jgi:ribosomal protein L21E
MYSKGMQKGLTALDKDFYDEEQEFRDEMTKAERNIRKKNADANDENIDILLGEYMEQQQVDADIDEEAYDMGFMNETYFDGNTDGVGAPEEEYDDYQEDN